MSDPSRAFWTRLPAVEDMPARARRSGLAEEPLQKRWLLGALGASLLAAAAASVGRDVAQDLLDVSTTACERRLVAFGAYESLAHGTPRRFWELVREERWALTQSAHPAPASSADTPSRRRARVRRPADGEGRELLLDVGTGARRAAGICDVPDQVLEILAARVAVKVVELHRT